MGRANERIARSQEAYVATATNGWLESLERSLAMMKEYQVCIPIAVIASFADFCRLPGRSSKTDDWHTMPPFPRCRKPRRKISESRRSFGPKKPNMRSRVRMFCAACRILKKPKQIALKILERSWMPNSNTMIGAEMNSSV
jgi:hypothetical protein